MIGDVSDIVSRLKSTLPTRWFPDETPVLDALLSGLSNAWSSLYDLLTNTRLQARIATVTGELLDGASTDYFGGRLLRFPNESDTAFRSRLQNALVREHATRAAVAASLETTTGFIPTIFEPGRITDTGAYGSHVLGYGVSGAWGNLNLPFQVFIHARRPSGSGILDIAGYGTGGPLARANLSQTPGQLTDQDIAGAVVSVLPTASIAWINISN